MSGIIRKAASAVLVATLAAGLGAAALQAQDASPVGDWEGALAAPGVEYPLVLHVTETEDGSLEASMDSPSQGAYGIEGSDVVFEEGMLTIQFPSIMGSYEATLSEDGNMLTGTWSQSGQSLDLALERVEG